MSPMPMASTTLAPQAASSLARIAGSPPPGSPATISRFTPELGEVHAALARPFGEMQRIGGRQRRRGWLKELTAAIRRSVFPEPTGMTQRPRRSNASSVAPATKGPAL